MHMGREGQSQNRTAGTKQQTYRQDIKLNTKRQRTELKKGPETKSQERPRERRLAR